MERKIVGEALYDLEQYRTSSCRATRYDKSEMGNGAQPLLSRFEEE
jgi:hypothetical protein